jgi:manganese/iron transport system substrate-binding protein
MNTLLKQVQGAVTMLLSVGLVTSCGSPPRQPDALATSVATTSTVKVVATSSVLCDLTKQIAAATVDLTCLVKPGSDPHVHQATPEDRKAIESANLILYSGYDFEPSLIQLIQATSNPAPKVAIAEVAVTKPLQLQEDGKTVTDPHVWHSAQNGIQMVAAIQSNLSKVAPANTELYTKNAQALTTELTKIDGWIKSQITTIPDSSRKLVTTHDALGYYSQAYGIPVEGALEGISTEEQPTANRVKELVKTIEAEKVPTIFAELTINPKLIETVAKEANVKVAEQELFADGLGEAGSAGETYQKMLVANTKTIVEGLGGKFSPLN